MSTSSLPRPVCCQSCLFDWAIHTNLQGDIPSSEFEPMVVACGRRPELRNDGF